MKLEVFGLKDLDDYFRDIIPLGTMRLDVCNDCIFWFHLFCVPVFVCREF